jgi:hypothetical protein
MNYKDQNESTSTEAAVIQRLDKLPAVLTSFAYRSEYFPELEGMIATVKEHHPDWLLVTGRGPVPGGNRPTFEVDSPSGKLYWSLPVNFDEEDQENEWFHIVLMKGWWMAQVWQHFGSITGDQSHRIVWLDADGRLNGPLDIELEPEVEVFASPWWLDPGVPETQHTACSGLLIFQGARNGVVKSIIDEWSVDCLRYMQLQPSPELEPFPLGDQDLLTTIIKNRRGDTPDYNLIQLDYYKYCGVPNMDGTRKPGALVDQWMMSERMGLPKTHGMNWPPTEDARRNPQVMSGPAPEKS